MTVCSQTASTYLIPKAKETKVYIIFPAKKAVNSPIFTHCR